jgi:quinol monooxygenase YgiN/branched-subunit amino acid transport protein
VAFVLILRWRSTPRESTLPGERFVGAMRAGLNFALQSPRLKVVLLRIFLFFLQSTALVALLPLVARDLHGGGPATFTVMLSCLGAGAVVAALYFPRWRQRYSRDRFVLIGTVLHATLSTLIVSVPEVWVALPAMVLLGMAWISVANSLTIAAQVALPDWVRARGMSIYQMALMGGAAAGSLLWGQVASLSSVRWAVVAAAVTGVLMLFFTRRLTIEGGADIDFSPSPVGSVPAVAVEIGPEEGPVMVTVEYQIDPANAQAFADVMQRTRRARLRQGALSWGLFRDTAEPGRYVEYFVDENWIEHQRRLERFTAFDADLRARRLAFHIGTEPPVLRRYVPQSAMSAPITGYPSARYCLILRWSVRRPMPSISAAPVLLPAVRSRVRRMTSRSISSMVRPTSVPGAPSPPAISTSRAERRRSSGRSPTSTVSPACRMTSDSIMFRSSRTFPCQGAFRITCMASGASAGGLRPFSRAKRSRNAVATSGTSARRSRNGGIRSVTTASR